MGLRPRPSSSLPPHQPLDPSPHHPAILPLINSSILPLITPQSFPSSIPPPSSQSGSEVVDDHPRRMIVRSSPHVRHQHQHEPPCSSRRQYCPRSHHPRRSARDAHPDPPAAALE